jgi:hypothetical protein
MEPGRAAGVRLGFLVSFRDVMPSPSPGSAESFFARARAMVAEGLLEYAIDLYLEGLMLDPGNIDVHKELRVASRQRQAAGGRDLGLVQKIALRKPQSDPVADMINREKLMSYDPLNAQWFAEVAKAAHEAGLQATEMYFAGLVRTALDAMRKGT